MPPLSEHQVNYVELRLSEANLTYIPIKEELLDHLCSSIEEQMETGLLFHQAVEHAFSLFEDQEFQNIEKQSLLFIHKKSKIMKVFSLAVLTIALSFPTISWVNDIDPPTIFPLEGSPKVTSGFGLRDHPIFKTKKLHKGVDFVAPFGTPVLATADGIVLKVIEGNKGYGNHIVLKHDEEYSTKYAQLRDMNVTEGEVVKLGQIIGTVGSSGTSTGPHLHYEVMLNGTAQDPEKYMNP